MPTSRSRSARGFTLIEVLVAISLGALVIVALSAVTDVALRTHEAVSEREALTREARFAIDQIVRMTRHSPLILLPFHDKTDTNWPEHIREETVPASPPVGDSTLATAVLAVTLRADQDLDGDGFADADDDRDGAIDEDLPNDRCYDWASGIYLIDDDGDGAVDEDPLFSWDDDERLATVNEDPVDGLDDDDDQNTDEDPASDNNGDGCPGRCGVDDDGDGQIDEGSVDDDDERGGEYEDWNNPVVFYLDGDTLMQRTPVPWDEDGSGGVDGRDFVVQPLAEHVSRFRVERLPAAHGEPQLVDLLLELTGPIQGERVEIQTRALVGGAL